MSATSRATWEAKPSSIPSKQAKTFARAEGNVCARGAWATPTFFVNGDMIRGELGVDGMSDAIEEIAALED